MLNNKCYKCWNYDCREASCFNILWKHILIFFKKFVVVNLTSTEFTRFHDLPNIQVIVIWTDFTRTPCNVLRLAKSFVSCLELDYKKWILGIGQKRMSHVIPHQLIKLPEVREKNPSQLLKVFLTVYEKWKTGHMVWRHLIWCIFHRGGFNTGSSIARIYL